MRHSPLLLVGLLTIAACAPTSTRGEAAASRLASASAPTVVATPPRDSATPLPALRDLDAALARWNASQPPSYAYIVESSITGMAAMTDRVIAIEGRSERTSILASSFGGWPDEQLTVAGIFEVIRQTLGRPGTIRATYDPVLGYPLTVVREDPTSSDGSWSMRIHDFRSSSGQAPAVGAAEERPLSLRLADARAAWARWAPSDYTYEWQRFIVSRGPTAGIGWSVRQVDGVVTTRGSVEAAATSADDAAIPATFDAIQTAIADGAWVEAAFDPVLGLPLVVGIDPTPAAGDGLMIRIAFRDIVAETGRAELEAARERWAANRPVRYSYVWRETGNGRDWTYRVTMDGDVASIRGSRGAPTGEAATLAPRIDDLFMLLEEVLADGGRVDAAYDPQVGYPTRVTIDAPGSLVVGTITIRNVVVDAAG